MSGPDARVRTWPGLACLTAALGCLVGGGCGDEGPPTWPVSGRVVFMDKSPVPSGVIEFAPVDGGPGARGKLDANGRFVLQTGSRLGAVAGLHRIAVVQVVLADGLPEHVRSHRARQVAPRYRRFESSGLERQVEASKSNEFEIVVQPTAEAPSGWGR